MSPIRSFLSELKKRHVYRVAVVHRNLLSEPKELALFDGVGHIPPDEMRIPAIRDFLERHLGARSR